MRQRRVTASATSIKLGSGRDATVSRR